MNDYRHDIEKYIKGELTPAERNALEKKALSDPFLADALEGAEQIKAAEFLKDVAALNERIAGKKTVSVWMWSGRIAAGLAMIAVSTFIVWSVMETEPTQELAMEKSEPAVIPPATTDSVTSATGTLSPAPVEQPTAGPAARDQDVATRSTSPSKTETKPKQRTAEEKTEIKNEPVAAAEADEAEKATLAEIKAEEIKVTESVAQAKPVEKETDKELARAKTADDAEARKLALTHTDKKKDTPAGKQDVAPASAERREAGYIASAPANVIRGRVTSVEDGTPIPGVNVVIKNSTIGTATDEQGNYQIETSDPNQTLVYAFIGMKSTEVELKNRKEVNVQMAIDATQLSEVVVTGYGSGVSTTVTPTVDMAHPEGGNKAFKQYLEKNLRYPEEAKTKKIEGRVTVEFTVESDGTLSNFNIILGIGSGCDDELIRLIKEGPKWSPTKYNKVPVQDTANVRLKFELPR